jgi:BMFP domain-containing protein YqiC
LTSPTVGTIIGRYREEEAMVADLWRDIVMKAVLERFSPLALRVLSDERVQTLLTQALNLQADMRENIEAQVKLVARTLELVTRDELSSLREVVKTLEAEVTRLREELKAAEAAKKPPEPAPKRPARARK